MASRLRAHLIVVLLLSGTLLGAPQKTYDSATSRSPHGALITPCQNCHTATAWKPIRNQPEFDHNQTRYPLRGLHEGVACRQCHTNLVFTNVGGRCADCHADIHRRQFGAGCEQCHSVKGWGVSVQSIQQHQNRFPLLGAHALLQCDDCHKGAATGQFQGLSTDCVSCHTRQFQQAVPDHVALKFPSDCRQCHTMDTWAGAKFDHLRMTGFGLTGLHARLECTACHVGGRYQGTPVDCVGCHAKNFATANKPDHLKAGFPTTCATCHNTSSWMQVNFDHGAFTRFPLTGAHKTVSCTQCHVNNRFAGTPTDCVSCHLKNFQGTTNPNHTQAGIPQTCQVCHNTTAWTPAAFDHSKSGFPLTGMHAKTPCASCHVNNNYNLTTTMCVSCHLKDFQGTTNPNHTASGFPQTCESCHNTAAWIPATFDHNKTGFPLTGMHAKTPCASCHVNNNYNLTSIACSSCHLKDYQATTDPNHVAAGFPTDCSICHSTSSWSNATFDHSKTGFALTGAHLNVSCQSCHVNNNFNLNSTLCVSCHLKDFQGTNNPNHAAAGFPQQCEVCHNTAAWIPASFDHSKTPFPLTGAHTKVACNSCHINGQFAGTPTDCYSCHKVDYQGTTNPNHQAAAFPTTCALCHNTTSWAGATFNHTWFPIYSGTHAGVWTTCGDCHTNPSNYAVFSCINCHTHDRSNTDPNHQGVRNYVYSPTSCYSCHPTGGGG